MITRFRPLRMETWVGPPLKPSKRRSRYTFKAGWADTVNLLERELAFLGAKEFVIEADFTESDIRLDGMPRANARQPAFPGVRIAFTSKHGPLVYQTDSCAFWQHNVRSVALGLEALRAVDRYGITQRAEQYTGFRAIGAAPERPSRQYFTNAESALRWLRDPAICGVAGAGGLSLKSLLRSVVKNVHPDLGGSLRDWDKYQEASRLLEEEGRL